MYTLDLTCKVNILFKNSLQELFLGCISISVEKKDTTMMIRQDFSQWPPKMYLWQILDPLSKMYFFLWEKKDPNNRLKMTWKEISNYYNKNNFRTSLRKLNEKALLNYRESDKGIAIEMIGWDEFSEEE